MMWQDDTLWLYDDDKNGDDKNDPLNKQPEIKMKNYRMKYISIFPWSVFMCPV